MTNLTEAELKVRIEQLNAQLEEKKIEADRVLRSIENICMELLHLQTQLKTKENVKQVSTE